MPWLEIRPMSNFCFNADMLNAEVCCGSAKYSFCLQTWGLRTLCIDYDRNRHQTWMPTVKLDLADPAQCQVLLELAQNRRIATAWIALPCGTCSRAREIAIPGQSFLPKPLRSEAHPRGNPGLDTENQKRVDAANHIYDNIFVLILALLEVGCFIIIENPSRSWLWSIPEYAHLLKLQFMDVEFQHCKWSGSEPSRNKWTRLRSNMPSLISLQGPCKAAHTHLPWGKQGKSFATADEAEYPMPMCEAVANCVAESLGVSSRNTMENPLESLSPHKLRRLTAGKQPRGRRIPPILNEFESVLTLPDTAPTSLWHRELRHFCERGAEGSEAEHTQRFRIVGVWRDPENYILEALNLQHPVDYAFSIPEVSRHAIKFVLESTPSNVVKHMVDQIRFLTKLIHDNENADSQMHDKLPDFAKPLMKDKKLATMQSLLNMFADEWPDKTLVQDITEGFKLTGSQKYSGVFDHEPRIRTMSTSDLRQSSDTNNQALFHRTKGSGNADLDKEAWEQTLEEQRAGWLVGPFHNIADLQQHLEDVQPHLSRRFPLAQGQKIRLIDDYLESNINATYSCEDKLTLMDVDAITAMLRILEASLNCEENVLASLDIKSQTSCWNKHPWTGTTIDLKSAYKQLFVAKEDHWASCISVFDPIRNAPSLFLQVALPFGAASSVLNFNRASRFLWFIGAKICKFIWGNFFDDFPIVASELIARPTMIASRLFFELLGWKIATGSKQKDFASEFTALGVTFSIGLMPSGQSCVYNSEKRTTEVLQTLQEILEKKKLSRKLSEALRGKLQFIESNTFGKIGKALYSALFRLDRINSDLGPKQLLILQALMEWLKEAKPRKLSPVPNMKPALLFTDGACEPSQTRIPTTTCGGLMIDPLGPRQVFGLKLSDEVLKPWMIGQKAQLVTEAELTAVHLALVLWAQLLQHRKILIFIDSEPAMFALIRGTSETPSCAAIVHKCHRLIEQFHLFVWFVRIPSKSNPADEPSRLQVEQAAKKYGAQIVECNQPET